jgi:hypothetical protein
VAQGGEHPSLRDLNAGLDRRFIVHRQLLTAAAIDSGSV